MKLATLFLCTVLLCACIPTTQTSSQIPSNQTDPSSLTDAVSDGRDNIPVWRAPMTNAQVVALETVRGFTAELQGAYLKPVNREVGPVLVDEIASDTLDRERILVLVAYQDGRTVLGVFDLATRSRGDPNALATRLEMALVTAFDAHFPRADLNLGDGKSCGSG